MRAEQEERIAHQAFNVKLRSIDLAARETEFLCAALNLGDDVLSSDVSDCKRDLRSFPGAVFNAFGHEPASARGHASHHDSAPMLFTDIAQLLERRVQFSDQAGSGCSERLSNGCHPDLTRRAIEQSHAQFGLKLLNCETDRALRNSNFLRCAAEAPVLRNCERHS